MSSCLGWLLRANLHPSQASASCRRINTRVMTTERRRLALEGLVIVLSILAAFSLDRWWDYARDRGEERQVLADLNAEFVRARQELEEMEELERRVLHSIRSVRDSVDEALARGANRVSLPDTALGWIYVPPTTQFVLGTRDALVASNGLNILRNRELRAALAAWGGALADMNEEELTSRTLVYSDVDRVFRARARVTDFREAAVRLLLGELSPSELARTSVVSVDREILGVLATRVEVADWGLVQFQPVYDEIDRILKLISESGARSGDS